MLVALSDPYWSRESLISRLRAKYISWHGEDSVLYGYRLQKEGQDWKVCPDYKNLVIEVYKDGEEAAITVTPDFDKDDRIILVMIPLSLVKEQLEPDHDKSERTCIWSPPDHRPIKAILQEEHIALRFRPPFNKEKETMLHKLVGAAYDQADSDDDIEEVVVVGETQGRAVVILGESRDGHDVTLV